MIFQQWELNEIIKLLDVDKDNLIYFNISTKLKQLMSTSINKRYTLRTTDWLSESAKKRKGKKRNKKINEVIQ